MIVKNLEVSLSWHKPPYKPLDKSFDNQGMLYSEMRRMYIFLEGKANMPQARREQSFVQLLEQIVFLFNNKYSIFLRKGVEESLFDVDFCWVAI